MTDLQLQEDLLAEVDDTLQIDGFVGLWDFSWSLRGLERGVSEQDVPVICRAAYDEFRRRRSTRLVWVIWPVRDLADARDAADDTPLDFDLDPDAPAGGPLLALVPA